MPYELKKMPSALEPRRPAKNYYKVINKNDGKVKAKHTTKEKGKRMIRLLDYIDAKKYRQK